MSAREYAEAYAAQESEKDRLHHQASPYHPAPPPPPPGLAASATSSAPAQPYLYTNPNQQPQNYQQYAQQYAQSYAPQQHAYSQPGYSQPPGAYPPSYSAYPPQQQQQSSGHAGYQAPYYPQHNQPHQGHNYAHGHSQYPSHYPGHPPPPPPPPSHAAASGYGAPAASSYSNGTYNPHTGNYQPNYQTPTAASTPSNSGVPSLASSFVKSTSNDLSIHSIVSPLSAPVGTAPASKVTSGRGEVSFAPSTVSASSASFSSSSSSSTSAISGIPAVGGIQFQMKKKSRWDNTNNALAKDTTVSKSVSETAAPPVAPSTIAAMSSSSTPFDPLKDYIERSLKACPPELYSRMTEILKTKIAGGSSIDWTREPLAHLQLAPVAAPLPPPPPPSQQHQYAAPNYNYAHAHHQQQLPSPSSLSYQRPMNNFPSGFQSKPPYLQSSSFTGANNMPLGVRPSLASPSSAGGPTATTPAAYEDADYIPFSNSFGASGKHGKKRGWGASQDSPSNTAASPSGGAAAAAALAANFGTSIAHQQQGNKKKKKTNHFGFGDDDDYSPQPSPRHNQLSAVDRAKVNDRASRFAEYNAEVAQSETVFKNPIQRHLFTAERGWGDEDLELDWSSLHIVGTCEKLEKRYLRLTQAPDPSVVRPEHVLQKSLQMVLDKWRGDSTGKPDSDHIHDYKYTCDQFKSMRQDLTVQHLVNSPLIFEVYEHHARIALEVGDYSEYNQCQTQLKNLYLDHPSKSANQLEFLSYRILYNLITNNQSALTEMLREIQKATDEQMQSTSATATTEAEVQARKLFHQPLTLRPAPAGSSDSAPSPISLAFQVAFAALQNDFFSFFRLYNSLPFQGPLILRPFAASFRFKALTTLVRSFRPGKVDVGFLERSLGLESADAAEKYIRSAGGVFTTDGLLDCKLTELHEIEEEEDDSAQHGVTHALL